MEWYLFPFGTTHAINQVNRTSEMVVLAVCIYLVGVGGRSQACKEDGLAFNKNTHISVGGVKLSLVAWSARYGHYSRMGEGFENNALAHSLNSF